MEKFLVVVVKKVTALIVFANFLRGTDHLGIQCSSHRGVQLRIECYRKFRKVHTQMTEPQILQDRLA